jgi:nucleoid-associated protein YgaU
VVGIAGVTFAVVALAASGGGALSPPPLGSPGDWQAWFDQRDPATAAFAILRLAAVGGCWYLAVTTVVGALLRLVRAEVLVALADRVTVPAVRRLLAGSLTLSLAGIGPTATLAAAQPAPSSTSVPSSTSTSVPGATTPDTITMRRLPAPGADLGPPVDTVVQPRDRWTVQPGDCFWSIADELLQKAWHRPPTDAEIVPYWLQLIEANRSELADPGNPHLIFPDQVFTVPPPPVDSDQT